MDWFLLQPQHHQRLIPPKLMLNSLINLSSKLSHKPKTLLTPSLKLRSFCTVSQIVDTPREVTQSPIVKPRCNSKEKTQIIKEKWMASLSYDGENSSKEDSERNNAGFKWVIGVDPDVSGALALLKSDVSGNTSAEVFDAPFVQVAVGKRLRKRLDARSIVQLVQSFDAPRGTIAYLEQSIPFPQDGKQGWWSGGFGYGLWIGILVASGYSVVPVPSSVWKKELELVRGRANKDDSRELARQLFPSLSSILKRKKDHGRAEALLIAAYGKGHKLKSDMFEKLDQDSPEAANETVIVETHQSLSKL